MGEIAWRCNGGTRCVVHPVGTLRAAEWIEGVLRLHCEPDAEVSLGGFSVKDYDVLWQHFSRTCGVYIRKRRQSLVLSEDLEGKLMELEGAVEHINDAPPGTVQKQAKEADFMSKVEAMRDCLSELIAGDKRSLSRIFEANSSDRLQRLRCVLANAQLETYARDSRFVQLKALASSVESVLESLSCSSSPAARRRRSNRMNSQGFSDGEESASITTASEMEPGHPTFYGDSILEGWLLKQSRYLKRWRRRYLVLTASSLASYRSPGNGRATEIVSITEFRGARNVDGSVKDNAFCVESSQRCYLLVCDDGMERAKWLRAISREFCDKHGTQT